MDDESGPGIRPTRTRIVARHTSPPAGATVLDLDERGPVPPRTFAPAPGWSPDGHRVTAPLEYGRGPETVWVYGALRARDGQAITLTTRSRNTAGSLQRLEAVAAANPDGELSLITDTRSSHTSPPSACWLAAHPRVEQVFLPKGACWLTRHEAWWRLFRKEALAGQPCADDDEIARATAGATRPLNRRAKPWMWGRPPRPKRWNRRCLVYRV